MDIRLDGKAALVTGASKGIGKAIASEFAASGAAVMLSSRKCYGLEAAAEEIRLRAPDAHLGVFPANGGDIDAGEAAVRATMDEFGGLDILVNNAATNPFYGPTLDVDPRAYDKTFEVNLRGPLFWSKAAHRLAFSTTPGVIVNIASVGGLRSDVGLGVYNLTKAAIIHLTRVLAGEIGPTRCRRDRPRARRHRLRLGAGRELRRPPGAFDADGAPGAAGGHRRARRVPRQRSRVMDHGRDVRGRRWRLRAQRDVTVDALSARRPRPAGWTGFRRRAPPGVGSRGRRVSGRRSAAGWCPLPGARGDGAGIRDRRHGRAPARQRPPGRARRRARRRDQRFDRCAQGGRADARGGRRFGGGDQRPAGATADDHWIACLPLAHVGGLSVVTRALHIGAALTVLGRFDADEVVAAARPGRSLVSLVATALARVDPTVFRTIVLGGARPPADLPANVVTTYGMTETGSGVVYDGQPLQGVDVRIDDRGEIHLRGSMLLRAYRDGSLALDPEGWLATGDLGTWGDDGRLVVHGRRAELIITGGENVWPQRVEDVLRYVPGIADVAVVGALDPEWGERVVAIVVPTDPSTPPSLGDLRAHAKTVLPAFCAPREMRLVERIPRTALGKPRRSLLGER